MKMAFEEQTRKELKTARWVEEYASGTRKIYRRGDCTLEGLQNILNSNWLPKNLALALARRLDNIKKLSQNFPNDNQYITTEKLNKEIVHTFHAMDFHRDVKKWKEDLERELK